MNALPATSDSATATRRALAIGGVAGVLASISEARTAWATARDTYYNWRSRGDFTVELSSDDPLYGDVVTWVDDRIDEGDRRTLSVYSTRTSRGRSTSESVSVPDSGEARPPRRLVSISTTSKPHELILDGHLVKVSLVKAEKGSIKADDVGSYSWSPDHLYFTARTKGGQNAVLRALEDVLAEREKSDRQPSVRILEPRWNSWRYRGDLPPRPLESVVLRAGQLERLVADLGAFLDAEAAYNARALPWHRGYLLEGPPGTGKTSVARALASHFGMDLWYAPLGDVKDDSSLLSLLGEVHPRSMILLEDVDVFAATRERQAENVSHVTLSGLLNALDGVATPHGLVTVMTTNKPRELDDALTRAGRMDVVELLELPDAEQATRLFKSFYGEDPPGRVNPSGRSTAAILERLKAHMYDPRAGYDALVVKARSL